MNAPMQSGIVFNAAIAARFARGLALFRRRWRDRVALAALAVILASGLYMRLANLGNVQHWAGDPGRDYLMVMEWGKHGRWPLLGPSRVTGDFTIGPGWFYTIAPAILLSHYSLAGGAGTVGVLSMLGVALAFAWVRRASGSALAALAVAALLGWGGGWVEYQRMCWNPQPLFFGLIALTFLIRQARRRPLRALALYAMLFLLLPQWHTSAWEAMLVSAPFMAWGLWLGRVRLRRCARRARLAWGLAVAAVFVALYLPPVLYELKPCPSNMASYFANLLPGHKDWNGARTPPPPRPWTTRLAQAHERLSVDLTERGFAQLSWRSHRCRMRVADCLALLAGLAFLRRLLAVGPRRLIVQAPAALFLTALCLSHGLLAAALDRTYMSYFSEIFLPAPILLAGWSAGTLARRSRRRAAAPTGQWGALTSQMAGFAAIGWLFWQACIQFPFGWNIHAGKVWHGLKCQATQSICKDLLAWAREDKYSVKLVETDENDASSYFQALLWRDGHRPANHDFFGNAVNRKKMGKVLFVVTREAAAQARLDATGLVGVIPPPTRDQDALIYRILRENLPRDANAVAFAFDRDRGVLKVRPVYKK